MSKAKVDTTPHALQTCIDVRREMAKNYRLFVTGDLDDKNAKTRTYMLQNLVGVIRDHELAAEVTEMREQLEGLKNGTTG